MSDETSQSKADTADRLRIDRNLTYHAPDADQIEAIRDLRERFRDLSHRIVSLVPPGRERALALTQIEEASMWANAGIVRPQ